MTTTETTDDINHDWGNYRARVFWDEAAKGRKKWCYEISQRLTDGSVVLDRDGEWKPFTIMGGGSESRTSREASQRASLHASYFSTGVFEAYKKPVADRSAVYRLLHRAARKLRTLLRRKRK